MSSGPVVLTLTERQPHRLDPGELSEETAAVLHRKHSKRIKIQWPSPVTDGKWVLKTGGWIGYLPVSEQLSIAVRPKVAVQNVFGMLEYAYRLKSFRVMDGLYGSSTLEELYSRLASVLARRVSDRVRQGLLRAYDSRNDDLPYLRGRLVTSRLHRAAVTPSLPCEFEEHGADIEDNQILLWTLYLLARVDGLHDKARLDVRSAWRALRGPVSLREFESRACVGRAYDRLNQDYEPMHALCRLFLENRGPEVDLGERRSVPFLVNMDRLYELFVFEWLNEHLPDRYRADWQESLILSEDAEFTWDLDVLIKESATDTALCIVDAKYKRGGKTASADLQQVVAYATAARCSRAVLCYPMTGTVGADDWHAGDVTVRRLTFGLEGDLEAGGQAFLKGLLKVIDDPALASP